MSFPAGWSGYWTLTFSASAIAESPGVAYVPLSDAPSDWWDALDTAGDTDGETIRVSDVSNALVPSWVVPSINLGTRTGGLFIFGGGISASVDTVYRVWCGGTASAPAVTDSEGRNATFGAFAGFYLPGVTTDDLTGNGRDLTAAGSPGTTASGYEGLLAATYNGSNQYHEHQGAPAVTGPPYMLEAVFTSASETPTQTILGLSSTSTNGTNQMLLEAAGSVAGDPLRSSTQGNTGGAVIVGSATDYAASTQYYMAGSRDTLTGGVSTVYVNGSSDGTNSTDVASFSTMNRTAIGRRSNSSPDRYLSGSVTLAAISDSARSADYVATMQAMWAGTIHTSGAWVPAATDSGWQLFQTAANVSSGDTAWDNVNNALVDDATTASCPLSNREFSHFLVLTNPVALGIPSGAEIADVEFRIKRRGGDIYDYVIRPVKGGVQVGTNLADTLTEWLSSDVTVDYGGGLLGTTWSDTDFGSGFGLAIQVEDTDAGADTAHVITVWTRVSWVIGGGGSTTGDGALTLPAPLTLSASGQVLIGGDGALTLPAPLTLSASGQVLIGGSGDAALPKLTLSGAGTVRVSGSGALTLPSPLALAAAGSAPAGGSGNCGFPALRLSGAGRALVGGSGNLNLTKLRTSGSGSPVVRGSGNLDLPVLELAGSNEPPVTTTGWFLFSHAETGPDALPEIRRWLSPTAALIDSPNAAYILISGNGPMSIRSAVLSIRSPVGISIPSGSKITSIDYKILRNAPSGTSRAQDYSVRPIKGGVPAGDDIADPSPWVGGQTEAEYGGSLMGLTWGAGDFGSDFGIAIIIDVSKELDFSAIGGIVTVWGRINFETVNPITGSGAIELPMFTMDSPPIPSTGSGTLTLPAPSMKAHSYNAACVCCEGFTMETLLTLRRMLAQQSGHLELVLDAEQEDWGDNGADFFIRAGHRFCDDQFQYHKSEAWFYKKAVSGQPLVTFKNARIIKQVWINYAGGQRTLLKRLTRDCIRQQYTEPLVASETTGTPLYWTPAVLGLAPQQFLETALTFEAEGLTDYDLIMFGDHYPYKGIYVMSPPDGDYTVEVLAEWYSYELCDDEDVNFWCQYPEISMMAARREMEIHLHRNTTGAQDFERPLMHSLEKLYHNLIAEESSGPTKIRRG